MTRFRTPANLASWAGVCPGHHESAGIRRSGKRRHGNRWLGGALGTAAMAAGRTRESTYLGARYARLVPRAAASGFRTSTASGTDSSEANSTSAASPGSLRRERCVARSGSTLSARPCKMIA